MTEDGLRRRDALLALGGLSAGALFTACGGSAAGSADPSASTAAVCVLQPEVTEGPYWIANHFTRRDITRGQKGLALQLHLTIVDVNSGCAVIRGADVELWHANARGLYSGFGGRGSSTRYLRGHQKSDAQGVALFDTIYPGWYQGRTPHIHLKVHVGGNVVHTGQVFFDDVTSDAVYRSGAYRAHGQPDTTNAADMIYAQAGGSKAVVTLAKRSGGKGYRGTIMLGVKA